MNLKSVECACPAGEKCLKSILFDGDDYSAMNANSIFDDAKGSYIFHTGHTDSFLTVCKASSITLKPLPNACYARLYFSKKES